MSDSKRNIGIYLLPNLFTISGLFAGFYAVVAAMKGMFDVAGFAVFVAMIADCLDGRVARLTNTESAFGAQFDSLSDMVAFGIAPALVIYSWSLSHLGKVGWLAAFFYVAATALRLARFNSQPHDDNRFFSGLPCPAAAGLIAGLVLFCDANNIHNLPMSIISMVVTIVAALLMVSSVRYSSFKKLDLKGKVSFLTILFVVALFILVSLDPQRVLFIAFLAYALSGLVTALWRFRDKDLVSDEKVDEAEKLEGS